MIDREKVIKGLECCANGNSGKCIKECPYDFVNNANCTADMARDALELLKDQDEIIDALLKVGYPHNFQREEPWIVNYMLNITDVVRKAVRLRSGEVKQDD